MSRNVSISVPDELFATLEAEHAARKETDPDASLSGVVRFFIEKGMAPPTESLQFQGSHVEWERLQPPALTFADAGEMLLKLLPEGQVDLIRQICMDNGRQPHEYLLSYAQLAHERGETAYLISGEDMAPLRAPKALVAQEMGQCAYCGRPFVMARQGQKYCPDPELEVGVEIKSCGRLATEELLHKKMPASLDQQHEIALRHGLMPPPKWEKKPAGVTPETLAQAVALALKQMGVQVGA